MAGWGTLSRRRDGGSGGGGGGSDLKAAQADLAPKYQQGVVQELIVEVFPRLLLLVAEPARAAWRSIAQ